MNTPFFILLLAVGLLIGSLIVKLSFLIPLYYRFALVKNGLARMRKLLLYKGVCQFIIDVLVTIEAWWVLTHFGEIRFPFASGLYFLSFAAGFAMLTLFDLMIFRQQYTPKNVAFHAKVEKLEKKEEKKRLDHKVK